MVLSTKSGLGRAETTGAGVEPVWVATGVHPITPIAKHASAREGAIEGSTKRVAGAFAQQTKSFMDTVGRCIVAKLPSMEGLFQRARQRDHRNMFTPRGAQ